MSFPKVGQMSFPEVEHLGGKQNEVSQSWTNEFPRGRGTLAVNKMSFPKVGQMSVPCSTRSIVSEGRLRTRKEILDRSIDTQNLTPKPGVRKLFSDTFLAPKTL